MKRIDHHKVTKPFLEGRSLAAIGARLRISSNEIEDALRRAFNAAERKRRGGR